MFTSLAEACRMANSNKKLNLIGIIVAVGLRRQSGGTNYVYTLQIADMTYCYHALSINFFASTAEELPIVRSFGDILVITDVKTSKRTNTDKPSVSCPSDQLSYALFGQNPVNGRQQPYYSCIYRYYLNPDLIQHFRVQCSSFQFGAGITDFARKISDMTCGSTMDLICKVLHVHHESQDQWLLYVWDGTYAPPILYAESMPAAEMQLNTDVEIPNMGSVLRVSVSCINFDEHLVLGRCVKLYDVKCPGDFSICRVNLSNNSKIRFLSDTTSTQFLRCYDERMPSTSNTPNMCSANTQVIPHDDIGRSIPDIVVPRLRNEDPHDPNIVVPEDAHIPDIVVPVEPYIPEIVVPHVPYIGRNGPSQKDRRRMAAKRKKLAEIGQSSS